MDNDEIGVKNQYGYTVYSEDKADLKNNSGSGPDSRVLDIVAKRFNWGAFFLSWIWGLGNKSYLPLLIFPVSIVFGWIPIINIIVFLGFDIWLGTQGNKWAWQNKRFESIEHFHSNQKKWAIAGLIVHIVWLLLTILIMTSITIPSLLVNTESIKNETMIKKEKYTAQNTIDMLKAMETKCGLFSEDLAKCFEQELIVKERKMDKLYLSDGSIWTFYGNGTCRKFGSCYINIDVNGKKGPNQEFQDIAKVYLKATRKGYLKVDGLEETSVETGSNKDYSYRTERKSSEFQDENYSYSSESSETHSYSSKNTDKELDKLQSDLKKMYEDNTQGLVKSLTDGLELSGTKCELSSYGLAKCCAGYLKSGGATVDGKVMNFTGTKFLFNGNGRCINKGDCSVTASTGNMRATVPLYVNEKGFLTTGEKN